MTSLDLFFLLNIFLICIVINLLICYLPAFLLQAWRQECHEFLEIKEATNETPATKSSLRLLCSACNQPLPLIYSIPLLNFLAWLMHCKHCGKIACNNYMIAQILVLACSYLAFLRFGISLELTAVLLFTWLLIPNAMIDVKHQILPDQLTFALLWIGLVVNLSGIFCTITQAVLGAITGYLVLFIIYHLYKLATKKEGMGYGDFKLLAAIGAWVGVSAIPFCLLLAALIACVVIGAKLALNKHKFQQAFPFGPFLALAGWLMLLYGSMIIHTYLRFLV